LIFTPRYFTVEFHEITVVLILYIKVINFFLFEMKNARHFDAFRRSCHLTVQEYILSRSFCNNKQSAGLVTSLYNVTSSAKSFRVECLTTDRKSSTYKRNKRGPSTEPCGTPDLTGSQSE